MPYQARCSCQTEIDWARVDGGGLVAVDHGSVGGASGDIAVSRRTEPGQASSDLHGRVLTSGGKLTRGEQYARQHRHNGKGKGKR